jgi:4-amino-4-deoxy-L-arabinose transferase-like glycosyltransferase
VALALVLLCAFGARVFYLGAPCQAPCRTDAQHSLIFDEAYYVNAARVIAGIRPPPGEPYATAPLHKDPNAEHPQLAKLIMAGTIELLGNNPWGWRLGSVIFGMLAIVAMYALVRAARGSPWLAVGAAGVMALDNLALIQSRIGTLDIYYLAAALVAGVLYVRGRSLWAGLALGVAACMKLIALGVLPAFLLLEVFVVAWSRGGGPGAGMAATARRRVLALLITAGTAAATLLLGVWLMNLLVPAYDPGSGTTYAGSPFTHISHMLSFASQLRAVPGATGISSGPWQWLLNEKTIDYYRVAVNLVAGGKIVASRALFQATAEVNPFVIFMAIPAVLAAVAAAWYERDRVAAVGAAWCVGTFIPFVVLADALHRISYIFYVLLVLPGIYLVVARLFSPGRVPRTATLGWVAALIYGFVHLYPVKNLSGH